ncbi:MAG: ABC transporter ATP-binding protein [Syntrophomonadaceae bacterium]
MGRILVENLSKTLDGLHTLDGVSMTVAHNELVVVLGPSGCGKSTLLHIIAGLITPDSGRLLIDGVESTGRTGLVGYMQQKDLLLPSRSVLDNICIPLLLQGKNKQEARTEASRYTCDFGLGGFESYYPRQLSGGMRQRAALLRTYLFSREILLLDEPFASLDAITRRKMQLWLKELHIQFGSSILFVTHDIEEALLLADRIYVFTARPARIRLELSPGLQNRPESKIKEEILAILEEEAAD